MVRQSLKCLEVSGVSLLASSILPHCVLKCPMACSVRTHHEILAPSREGHPSCLQVPAPCTMCEDVAGSETGERDPTPVPSYWFGASPWRRHTKGSPGSSAHHRTSHCSNITHYKVLANWTLSLRHVINFYRRSVFMVSSGDCSIPSRWRRDRILIQNKVNEVK